MASRVTPDDRLDGWEAIAKYLGWTPRTVIRWEKQKGLPVHRVAGGKRQPVYAYRREIDFWFEQTGGARTIAISLPNEPEREPTLKSSSGLPGLRVSRRIQQTVAGIILLTATLGAAWRISTQPAIQITGVTQLTDDGTAKEHLVTDGRQLYFSEDIGDEKVLSTMAAGGGPIRRILLPISNPYPVDVSPDGRSLLVLSDEDREAEHRLWVVPAAGGPPHDMAGIRCRAAAWSPNGEWIAFGSGNAIYLVSRDGSQTRLLTRLAGVPATIRWSADGRHLFVVIGNLPANTTSLWQVSLSYFRGTNGGGGYLFGSESDAVRANFSRDFGRTLTIGFDGSYMRTSGLLNNGVTIAKFGGAQATRRLGRYLTVFANYTATAQSSSSVLPANTLSGLMQVVAFGIGYSSRETHLRQ